MIAKLSIPEDQIFTVTNPPKGFVEHLNGKDNVHDTAEDMPEGIWDIIPVLEDFYSHSDASVISDAELDYLAMINDLWHNTGLSYFRIGAVDGSVQ